MRLRIDFSDGTKRDVNWWQDLDKFPTVINFHMEIWEWVMYTKDYSNHYDYILTFGLLPGNDPRWYTGVDFDELLKFNINETCECGSIHDAPNLHMFYCKMWRRQ